MDINIIKKPLFWGGVGSLVLIIVALIAFPQILGGKSTGLPSTTYTILADTPTVACTNSGSFTPVLVTAGATYPGEEVDLFKVKLFVPEQKKYFCVPFRAVQLTDTPATAGKEQGILDSLGNPQEPEVLMEEVGGRPVKKFSMEKLTIQFETFLVQRILNASPLGIRIASLLLSEVTLKYLIALVISLVYTLRLIIITIREAVMDGRRSTGPLLWMVFALAFLPPIVWYFLTDIEKNWGLAAGSIQGGDAVFIPMGDILLPWVVSAVSCFGVVIAAVLMFREGRGARYLKGAPVYAPVTEADLDELRGIGMVIPEDPPKLSGMHGIEAVSPHTFETIGSPADYQVSVILYGSRQELSSIQAIVATTKAALLLFGFGFLPIVWIQRFDLSQPEIVITGYVVIVIALWTIELLLGIYEAVFESMGSDWKSVLVMLACIVFVAAFFPLLTLVLAEFLAMLIGSRATKEYSSASGLHAYALVASVYALLTLINPVSLFPLSLLWEKTLPIGWDLIMKWGTQLLGG